jgi:hypothetical protein
VLAKHLHTPDDFVPSPFEHLHYAPAAALTVPLPYLQPHQDAVTMHDALHSTAWQVNIVLLLVIWDHKAVPISMPPDHPDQGIQPLR